MRKRFISDELLITFLIVASAVYALSIFAGASIGAITGLIIGIVEINIINASSKKKGSKFILAVLLNIGLTVLFLKIGCLVFANIACQRNPFFLSIIPPLLLMIVLLPLSFYHIQNWIKSNFQ